MADNEIYSFEISYTSFNKEVAGETQERQTTCEYLQWQVTVDKVPVRHAYYIFWE